MTLIRTTENETTQEEKKESHSFQRNIYGLKNGNGNPEHETKRKGEGDTADELIALCDNSRP